MPSHAPTIARWFHLPYPLPLTPPDFPSPPLPAPGQILLLTGPSGSGKSTLLRHLHHTAIKHNRRTLTLPDLPLPDRPTIDTLSLPLPESLSLLSLVGLAEAHTYLLPPRALSDGQRWRLRLALALSRPRTTPFSDGAERSGTPRSAAPDSLRTQHSELSTGFLILADEFAALLDRVTALTLSRTLRRLTTPASNLSFALATSHSDLLPALAPDIIVHCDFNHYTVERQNEDGG